MVDFDDLRKKAEGLLGEHGDQVEEGIDKLADLAGKKYGHESEIDKAAGKLKDFVDDQSAAAHPKQQRPRPKPGAHPRGEPGPHPRPR